MKWLFFFIPDAILKKPAKKSLGKKDLTPKQKNFIARKKKSKN